MKLQRFTSKKLHGFLNFDVRFDDRLTFLTGINGSGKTTILNAIVALITPNLAILQALNYNEFRLDLIDDDGKKAFIKAIQKDNLVTLEVNGHNQSFAYLSYVPEPSMPSYRQTEAESEHYRELIAASSGNPALRFIASLPTPMFLGLDRRARLSDDTRRPFARPRQVVARNVFGGSLVASLAEAEDLAQEAYRDARFKASRIGDELQGQVLLSLLTFAREDWGEITFPSEQEIKDLRRVNSDLEEFPRIFNLPKDEVERGVRPFIELLQKTVERIPKNPDIQNIFDGSKETPPYFSDLIAWSANKSQLKKIKVISQTVSQYNERRANALKQFETYKNLVNDFLVDSGKSIDVGDHGEIFVNIDGVVSNRSLASLSSGEAQIFVILTNLAFNPAAQKANVFIIDEPELSLHVRWQEKFVDSALSSNTKIQFIMATHSPSIILERLSSCIEVSGRKVRG